MTENQKEWLSQGGQSRWLFHYQIAQKASYFYLVPRAMGKKIEKGRIQNYLIIYLREILKNPIQSLL